MARKKTPEIDKILEKARQAEERQDHEAAARSYTEALEISQKNPGIWGLLGWALLHAGDTKEALTAAKKMRNLAIKPPTVLSLPSKPLLAVADLLIAEIHRSAGRKTYAERYYRESLDAMPRAATYVLFGEFLAGLDRHTESKVCYQNAIQVDSNCDEAHYNLALWYKVNEDYERTIRHLQRVLEINPMNTAAVVVLTRVLWRFRSTGFSEALNVLENAYQVQPNERDIQLCLAFTYRLLKKTRDAERIFIDAVQTHPEDSGLHWSFAHFLGRDLKQAGEAEFYFKKAIELDPENAPAWFHYGQFLLRQKREEEAQIQLNQAMDLGFAIPETEKEAPVAQPIANSK